MTHAAISVVMPLYNKAAYVRRSIASVLSQTLPPRELIIVDDGSTDAGPSIAAGLSSPLVRIVHQSNRGPGSARNRGLQTATSQWVALLDADDIWLPNHLEEIDKLARAFPSAGLISTQYIRVPTDRASSVGLDLAPRALRGINYFIEASKNAGIVSSSTCALRRALALELGGFTDAWSGEDVAFWARIAIDHPVAVSDRKTAIYARHTGGLTESAVPQGDAALASMAQVCPVLDLIQAQRARHNWQQYPRDVQRFIDSWLLTYLRLSIYHRHFRRANSIARMLGRQRGVRSGFLRTIARFPNALGTVMRVRDAVRRHAR